MTYQGYNWELKIKRQLQKDGWIVFKCSRRSYCDFVAISPDISWKDVKLIECKSRKDKWYMKPREVRQAHLLMELHEKGFAVEYHIKVKDKVEILTIEEFFEKYMNE